MAGQAPYVINTGFTYDNIDKKFEAGLFYNVQGPTLVFVGGSLFPDVFAEPFHSLNFNLNKRFGEEEKFSINIGIDNILDDVREEFYTAFQSTDQYFTRIAPGNFFWCRFHLISSDNKIINRVFKRLSKLFFDSLFLITRGRTFIICFLGALTICLTPLLLLL